MTGPWLVLLGRGRGDAEVDPSPYVARSHGREVTFQRNIKEWDQVQTEVARLARQVAAEVEERPVARAVVKVRYAPFTTVTHGAPFPAPGNADPRPGGLRGRRPRGPRPVHPRPAGAPARRPGRVREGPGR